MIKRNLLSIVAALSVVCCGFIVWKNQQPKPSVSYSVFHSQSGWGYNIFIDTSIFIHQDMVPTLATQKGFGNRQQAIASARLVINKMKNGQLPTLTQPEIQHILLQKGSGE